MARFINYSMVCTFVDVRKLKVFLRQNWVHESMANANKYYAVAAGRQTGIFHSWAECEKLVTGYTNARFKRFDTAEEAKEYVTNFKNRPVQNTCPQMNVNISKQNGFPNNVFVKSNEHDQRRLGSWWNERSICSKPTTHKTILYDSNKYITLGLPCDSAFQKTRNKKKLENKDFIPLESETSKYKTPPKLSASPYYRFPFIDLIKNRPQSLVEENILEDLDEYFTDEMNQSHQLTVKSVDLINNTEVDNKEQVLNESDTIVNSTMIEEPASTKINTTVPNFNLPVTCLTSASDVQETVKNMVDSFCKFISVFINKSNSDQSNISGQITRNLSDSVGKTNDESVYNCSCSTQQSLLTLNTRVNNLEAKLDSVITKLSKENKELNELKQHISLLNEQITQLSDVDMFQAKRKQCSESVSKPSCSRSNTSRKVDNCLPGKKRKRSREERDGLVNDRESQNNEVASAPNFLADKVSFITDQDSFVNVFTDGACEFNGTKNAKAGIGIWFGPDHPLNVSSPVIGPATNNTAEIQAARVAVELAKKSGISQLQVNTDSEFLINCITKWIFKWKQNGFKLASGQNVKNKDELVKLDKSMIGINVRWKKVLAHSGVYGNEQADRLAVEGAKKYVAK